MHRIQILADQLSYDDKIKADLPPVLLLHGDVDLTVPYSSSVKMFEILKQNNVSVQMELLAGKRIVFNKII